MATEYRNSTEIIDERWMERYGPGVVTYGIVDLDVVLGGTWEGYSGGRGPVMVDEVGNRIRIRVVDGVRFDLVGSVELKFRNKGDIGRFLADHKEDLEGVMLKVLVYVLSKNLGEATGKMFKNSTLRGEYTDKGIEEIGGYSR